MPVHQEEHSLPAIHALHLAEIVKRWDVAPDELLAGLGLREEALADPEARLSVRAVTELVERARALTGEPGLGLYVGMHMRASAHGYLGFAAMMASTVREALDLASRFSPMRTTAIALRLHVDESLASLVLEERADFGPARDAVLFALAVGIWQIGIALTGKDLRGAADFAFAEPPYFARFGNVMSGVRFGQPANQLVFDASVLDIPLTMADPTALRLAREECKRALDALAIDGQLVGQVRALIAKSDGGARSLEEVAAEMAVSPRTLKRKLAAHGAAYSALVEDEQREKALLLLRSSELSVDDVADRLGYSDVANFTRAFRRWTGTTPAAYRRAGR
jgi:AraC-like DNA-binding protein